MNLKLRSDFHDFYDLWFDREGETFERMSRTSMDRMSAMYRLAFTLNLPTPAFGFAEDLASENGRGLFGAPDDSLWVLHTDPFAHCGEGKIVLAASVIRKDHAGDLPITEYIPASRGKSIRHLQVGNRAWQLSYESRDDWRSNSGDVTIKIIGPTSALARGSWPLFAVDFVADDAGKFLAIDLNTSPGMSGTGMEDVIKPREVVDEIKGWLSLRDRRAI